MWAFLAFLLSFLAAVESQFDPSGCDISKACFLPADQNCYLGCNGMQFSYKFVDDDHTQMEIEIAGKSDSPTGFYFAVGFSYDDMMGNDSVIECSSLGNETLSLKFSYNVDKTADSNYPTNVRIENQNSYSSYFKNAVASFSDGQVYCSAVVNVGGAKDPRVFKFEPDVSYYLLMANGPTDSKGLQHHVHDVTSDGPVNLVDIRPAFNTNGCGVTKGCFLPTKNECYGSDLDLSVSYLMINNTHLKLELVSASNESTGHYVAVAFSKDRNMGNASVIECSSLGTQALSTKFSYNTDIDGERNNNRIDGEPAIRSEYIDDNAAYQDGNLYCSAVVRVTGDDENPEIFKYDPNEEYFLLLAKGSTNSDGLLPHNTACAAEQKTKLTQLQPSFDTAACGSQKNCFVPTVCYRGCNGMGFSYKIIGPNTMKVELFSVAKSTGYYVALGFSYDQYMGNDSVIECSSIGGKQYSMKYSYNVQDGEGAYNTRIKGESVVRSMLISNEIVEFTDGRLYCSATINIGGSKTSPEIFKYDQDVNYWLLMASGTTSDKDLNKHFDHVVSDTAFNLQTGEAIKKDDNPPTPVADFNCSECGTTKGCFFPKGSDQCTGMGFAYQYISDTEIQMELMQDASSGYVAVGFSPDGKMGNVPVIECSQLTGAAVSMKFSYNQGSPLSNNRIPNETTIEATYFKNPTYKVENGQMYCRATVNVGGWIGDNRVFTYDPSKNYFLLIAKGLTTATGLRQHSDNDRQASGNAVDLKAIGKASAGMSAVVRTRLIHAHAVMMILSWVCFVPTAMLFARFLRASWPLVKPGGLLIWFHVHRTCNLLGILLMIASFVCIMCANEWEWTGPGSKTDYWPQVHTMTGLLAVVFAWMQPFISFMRCHPNTPNRPIFNWIHRSIGVIAFTLATTALSIAGYQFTSLWGNPGLQLGLMLIPISLIVILCFFNPLLDFLQAKDESNYPMLEMVRQVVVLVSVGLLAGDAVALCVMVCM